MANDTLIITGGGSYAVASDDQLARVQRLETFTETARTIVEQLQAVSGSLTPAELRSAQAPQSAFDAERELGLAVTLLSQVADRTEQAARATRAAMLAYGEAENTVEGVLRGYLETWGAIEGTLAGGSTLLWGGFAVFLMGFISPSVNPRDPGAVQKFVNDHPLAYSNVATVELIKLMVDAIGQGTFSSGFVPTPVVNQLTGMGLTGPEIAAIMLIGSGAATGKLRDSGESVSAVSSTTTAGTVPTGWADRIGRIPDTANNGGAQIRIDKFVDANGKRSFEVYLSGTQTFSTSKTSTPFDLTSDMGGIAGKSNAAVRSVEKAMKAAGIKPGDPVNITGHSEGGLVAHEVAASGRWNVQVALEAGPPAAATSVPSGTTEVVLAHNEDIVTALGGSRTDNSAIVVHATAFPDGTVPAGESMPPAHNTERYQHTAQLLDTASSSMITDARAKADANEKGATGIVTTTLYKAVRVWKN